MEIKPILFNTEMVKAILEGRKSCTRRAANGIVRFDEEGKYFNVFKGGEWTGPISRSFLIKQSAKYQAGDILWVRETWKEYTKRVGKAESCHLETRVRYKASDNLKEPSEFYDAKWKPSIFMPKEACRIFLKVTGVKVGRLQDITEDAAIQEGTSYEAACECGFEKWQPSFDNPDSGGVPDYREAFSIIWDSTVDKKQLNQYGWEANPYVWVYEFERCEKPEGWCE